MPKQNVAINFAQGLDLKTDPKQVQAGKFLSLKNTIFDKAGLLQKRNGFGQLPSLPNSSYTYLTTLNNNLTAIGPNIAAYSSASQTWVSRGTILPLEVTTLPLIRNNANQSRCDTAIAPNGLVCTVYSETANGTTYTHKYAVANSITGQNIVAPTALPGADSTYGSPRVFLLGNNFVIVFTTHPSSYHLQFIAISTANPTIITSPVDITSAYTPATTVSWDAIVYSGVLFVAFNTTSGGQSVKISSLNSNLALTGLSLTFAGSVATMMSLAVDSLNAGNPVIYAAWYDSASSTGYVAAVGFNLGIVLNPVEFITTGAYQNVTCLANAGVCTLYYEAINNYGYDSSLPTHYIQANTVTRSGTLGTAYVVVRSVGLASKAFAVNGINYFLAAFQSLYQNTYFLINASTSTAALPVVVGKLAYENGGGYCLTGLPSVSVMNGAAQFGYLYKDLIEALTTLNNSQQTTTGGIYSQTGVNLGTFTITEAGLDSAEIANTLNISGGFLWSYDGYLPVEQNFFLWPDNVEATWSATGGSMAAQPDGATNASAYAYQAVYSWADNNGNINRSAPSIPVFVTTTGTGTAGSVTLTIPTLRLTYKVANPVKIEVYRWSVHNQNYFQTSGSASQVNPILAATLNSTTSDYVTFVDTWADASIQGNNLIYTTGGVVEDVNGPASNIFTLFDTRLWLVDAEDPNLLWYSKQVIEAVPVEMSDLFTVYISPSQAAQGNTGNVTALAPLDDKLIIFKENAIYYINGAGPDNTGANNGYSQPTFITSTVGCSDPNSIVFTPEGLLFQSDKGIWLLGRGLDTSYKGKDVQGLTLGNIVQSSVNVPETNQVRFTLNTGVTLMFDYFYEQWGEFVGIPAISSCIYNGLHTFINQYGQAFQETPGLYLDGTNPVLMQFTTSWLNLAGLQGYQRFEEFYLMGDYISPHKLQVYVGYDYNIAPQQQTTIKPINYSAPYGTDSVYGAGSPFGGAVSLEEWRIHSVIQKCKAFQITVQEIFDPTLGSGIAGAGLTLSGINCVVNIKKGWSPIPGNQSAG